MVDARFAPGTGSSRRFLFTGNEALVRGCLEAGVGYVAQYPGTPTSDIGETFQQILADQPGLRAQLVHHWSTNEAVATSSCAGAAWAGIRALNPMKHVGMNVASDALLAITLNGPSPGAMVCVVGSDPGSLGSHHEQNERFYSWMLHTPVIEPHTPQECHDWIKLAFELSTRFDLPVYFRTSTRTAHSRGQVAIGDFLPTGTGKGSFTRDVGKFCSLPPFAINNHVRLYERIDRLTKAIPGLGLNTVLPGDATTGVITYGMPFGYVVEALHGLGLDDVPVLKLGMTYPLHDGQVVDFIKDLDKVIVVEELEPFLEVAVRDIAQRHGLTVPVIGGEVFPKHNEFNTGLVAACIARIAGKDPPPATRQAQAAFDAVKGMIPSRFPTFCPGCPERAMLVTIKQATGNLEAPRTVIAGDIGCYVMGIMPPLNVSDFIICMSGGISAAIGLSKKTDDKIIALIGDSTFMHTGMPALADAIANDASVLLVIFDNRWVAMTGHQAPSGKGRLSFESLVKAMGVSWVKVVDPFKLDATTSAVREGLHQPGVKVIICQRECALMAKRAMDKDARALKVAGEQAGFSRFQVYNCVMCGHCYEELSCPAMRRTVDEHGNEIMQIDEDRCNACSVCNQLCPHNRIKKAVVNPHVPNQLALRRVEP